jgi:hypothetical protein
VGARDKFQPATHASPKPCAHFWKLRAASRTFGNRAAPVLASARRITRINRLPRAAAQQAPWITLHKLLRAIARVAPISVAGGLAAARHLMALQGRLVLMLRSPRRWRICAVMTWGVAGLFSCGAQTGRRHHPKDMMCYRLPVLMGPFLLGPKLAQIRFQMHEATGLVSCWANTDPNRTNKKMMCYRITFLRGQEWIQI